MTNIIYGFHSITSLIKHEATAINIIYLDHKRKDKRQQDIIAIAKQNNIQIELLTDDQLTKLIGSDKHLFQKFYLQLIPKKML
ncbi:MAG TPA: RNA methyltransferase substrate-binding domain-containing protein [Burkholderiales bacterium]|nr:RNA methyltransferase substrate-binding domain-containing protein [Burkholderiales bacterium]